MARRGESITNNATRVLSKIDLHIVSFNVPLPADYGGVIDVFYKLEALSKLGYKIALHCFEYGREEVAELKEYAAEVHYYTRKANALNAVLLSPFSVKSRKSSELLKRLASDDAPILFESLQCCYYLDHRKLANKRKWVRAHNVEHDYYRSLSEYENANLKKSYYSLEAKALRKFEKVLRHADGVFAISPKDNEHFINVGLKGSYLPAFFRKSLEGISTYSIQEIALYQGNLKVEENVEAVLFLLTVFKELQHELVIAGSEPSSLIVEAVSSMKNVKLVENPSDEKMFDLIGSAKINCLPTFQSTGIKLKLLHALTSGNEILVNPAMIEGTGLNKYCIIAKEVHDWREKLTELFAAELNKDEIKKRQIAIAELFDNQKNAKQLAELLGLAQ